MTTIMRATNLPEGGTIPDVGFSRYGEPGGKGYTLHDLMAMNSADGMLHARAENSGSEGEYCEVAIWSDDARRWERFAFAKFHGGEFEIGGQDANCDACAEFCAKLINQASGAWNCEDAPLVHRMPNHGSATAPDDIMEAAKDLLAELAMPKYVGREMLLTGKRERLAEVVKRHETKA